MDLDQRGQTEILDMYRGGTVNGRSKDAEVGTSRPRGRAEKIYRRCGEMRA